MSKSSFTVFFEDPFWVGVYEREEGGRMTAAKVTFGPEPRDGEVYEFLLENWRALTFGPAVEAAVRRAADANPKRRRRAAAKQLGQTGVGTRAQQALALAREQDKQQRRETSRAQKLEEQRRQYALRAQKRKEKHKGH